jgi:hypothetical protein
MKKERIKELRKQFIAENDGKSTIVLKAVYGKQQGFMDVQPIYNQIMQKFEGVEELTEEEKKSAVRVITEDSFRRIEDGMVVDLNRDIDVVDWAWMKLLPQVEKSLEDAQSSRIAMFYVHNEETLVKEKIKKTDLVFEALTYIKKSSETERSQRCKLLVGSTSYFSALEIEDYLKEKAMTEPQTIINIFNDENFKTKLFLFELINDRIINIDQKDKIYRFRDRPIGASEKAVLEFLIEPANQDLVAQLKLEQEMNKKK